MNYKKSHILLALFLPIQIGVVQYLSKYQSFIENYYAKGLYPIVSKALRFLFGWVPFSVGDVFLLCLLFLSFRFLFQAFKSRGASIGKQLITAAAVISIVHFCFYLFWGFNYFRAPLEHQFPFSTSSYSTEELTQTTEAIIEQLNQYHLDIGGQDTVVVQVPYERKTMYAMAQKGYFELSKDYPELAYKCSSVKHSLMSTFQSYNGTSGYLNPLTGEAQVNAKIPKTGYPTTVCHEIAHQIGYAAENEANFIGFLAANYNSDIFFKYSSYRMALAYCLGELRKRDASEYNKMIRTINKGILKDYNASSAFWQQYKNPFEPIMKRGYNAYLKANRQTKGIESYNYVVDLLISYYRWKGAL